MTEVITYETLYEILRKEKYNQDLQNIDKEFFKKVATYLDEKERLITQAPKDSAFSKEIEATRKQVENAKRLIKEIYERRENKILQLAMLYTRSQARSMPTLLPEEDELYKAAVALFTKYRNEILENILKAAPPQVTKESPKTIKTEKGEAANKLVRFIHPTPAFVAPDLQVYGPFDKEDIGNLPKKVASVLIKKSRAEEINNETK